VNVIDPVIVAVHVHVNAPADVIDAVDDSAVLSVAKVDDRSGSAFPRS
jgi:hypothetical protein